MSHTIVAFALLLSFEVIAYAAPPPQPPDIYNAGPTSPQFANAGLFASERATYALLEGAMQEVEAVIAATNCAKSVGTYDLNVFSDGSENNPSANWVIVDSPASTFTLYATMGANDRFEAKQWSLAKLRRAHLSALRLPIILPM